jgi:hypothetical protein
LKAARLGHADILATCPRGQALDLDKLGWNYDTIKAAMDKEAEHGHNNEKDN